MKLHISEIPKDGLDFHFTPSSGELNSELGDILGDKPDFDITLNVQLLEDLINVQGRFEAVLHNTCSRCAEEFNQPIHKSFLSTFCLKEESFKGLMGSLPEILAEDDASHEVDFLQGDELDLSQVVHEQMVLEIPFAPICEEDCKGLCLQCGENLNITTCQCKPVVLKEKASPFAALKNLSLNGKQDR